MTIIFSWTKYAQKTKGAEERICKSDFLQLNLTRGTQQRWGTNEIAETSAT